MMKRDLAAAVVVFAAAALAPAIPRCDAAARSSADFAVARIRPELAKDADIVVREDTRVFDVQSAGTARQNVRIVTTVMNSRGREAGNIALPYDTFHKVTALDGWILDADGREIRHLRKSDTQDYSAIQGFSLYEDARVKYAELSHDNYPYTIVYEYEVAYDGVLGWPAWWPANDRGPVEKSVFEIRVPSEMTVRHQAVGFSAEPRVIDQGSRRIYQWSLSGLPKFDIEPLGPAYAVQAPHVLTGPARFEIGGKTGDMSSWGRFGAFFHDLWEGKTVLPPEEAARVKELCAGAGSDREKARRLYEYLQSKTRYVSVQLGLGGWEPFDASYVSRLGYGDCKALTNYMRTLLGAAGIEAWPAFVMAGDNAADVVDTFPSNQFNHVILFVPSPADTLWLECTSQSCPFGQLGTFTEDRWTFVPFADGGRLVRTPATSAGQNRLIRRARVLLGPAGQADAEIVSRFTGNQQGDVRLRLATATPRERDEWLRREIDLPGLTVRKADFSDLDRKSNDLNLSTSIYVQSLASSSGPRLFVPANLLDRWSLRLPKASERKQPVRLPYPYVDADTIAYQIPPGYDIEGVPPVVKLERPFGTYESSVVVNGGTIEYHRRFEMRQRSVDMNAYEDFRQFLDEIVKADQAKLVLIRKS